MKRNVRLRWCGALGMCLILASVNGCSADESAVLENIAKCGRVAFPDSAQLIADDEAIYFGDQTLEAVVDIPAGEVENFKSRSGLGVFESGVPLDWRKYWQNTGVSSVLERDEGNEHSPEPRYPQMRWVVVHDSGGDTRRIFVRAAC